MDQRQENKKGVMPIKELESQIEQLHVATLDNPLLVIPAKRTNLNIGSGVGATVFGKIKCQNCYILQTHNGRFGRLHIS